MGVKQHAICFEIIKDCTSKPGFDGRLPGAASAYNLLPYGFSNFKAATRAVVHGFQEDY